MTLRVACVAMLAVLLAACSTTIARVEGAGHKRPDPKTQMAALERRIYEVIEQERKTIDPKLKPLALDSELTGVARARSADMAAKHYVGHKAPDGETAATLIMARDAGFQGLLAENIAAQHYVKKDGVDVDALAKRFVDTWLASKTQRENLASAEYNHIGIGAGVDSDTVYVMLLFSTDLGLKPRPDARPHAAPDAAASGGE
jgi:uncharacterized protein YkwD